MKIVNRRPKGVAEIPDEEVYKSYRGRKIGGRWDRDILEYAQANELNVLLMGDTGAGKTLVGKAYASKTRQHYYSLPCDVSIDPTALFGKMTPQEDGSFAWVDGPVTELFRYGGVLNISEINFMPPKIAAALYPALDGRRELVLLGNRGEVVRAHPRLLIIADMNPGYRGTQQLNAAFMNRWPLKIEWGYDADVERALVPVKALRDIVKALRKRVGTDLRTPISTNMAMEFVNLARDLGSAFAVTNFIAAFQPDERPAITEVFKLNDTELTKELAALWVSEQPESASAVKAEPQVDAENLDDEFEDTPEFELDDEEDY